MPGPPGDPAQHWQDCSVLSKCSTARQSLGRSCLSWSVLLVEGTVTSEQAHTPKSQSRSPVPRVTGLLGSCLDTTCRHFIEFTWRSHRHNPISCGKVGLASTAPTDVSFSRSVLAAVREYPAHVEGLLRLGQGGGESQHAVCSSRVRSGPLLTDGKYCVCLFDVWEKEWRELCAARLSGLKSC